MFGLDPLNALAGLEDVVGNINGATGGAAGALLPPPLGTDSSIAPNAPGAKQVFQASAGALAWDIVLQNLGVLIVGILLFFLGIGLLTFAWGEHIANTVESVSSKLPVVPV